MVAFGTQRITRVSFRGRKGSLNAGPLDGTSMGNGRWRVRLPMPENGEWRLEAEAFDGSRSIGDAMDTRSRCVTGCGSGSC